MIDETTVLAFGIGAVLASIITTIVCRCCC